MRTSLLFACLLLTTVIAAQTWTGAVSSDWNTPGNWSPATVPNASSNVTFNNSTPTCNLDISTTIGQLQINGGSLIFGASGALTISNGFFMTGPGNISLGASGSLTSNSTTLINAGTFNAGSGTLIVPNSFFSIDGAAFDAGSATIQIGTGWQVNASLFTAGTSTVIFNGTSGQNVEIVGPSGPTGRTMQFYNLTIDKANSSALQINGTLTDTFQVNNKVLLTDGQLTGNGFLKVEKDLWSQSGFDGTAVPIACTGPNTSNITIDAVLAVTGPTPFVGIFKSNPSVEVNVFTNSDTLRIGNFNANFFIRRGIFQFPDNPPVISDFGNLTIEPEGTLIAPQNYLFNGGRHINTGGVFDANGGTYVFYHNAVPAETDLTSNRETFNNLIIDIPGGQINPGLNDTLIVEGNLILRSGQLLGQAGSAFNVKGSFTFEAGMTPTLTNTRLVFSGTRNQDVTFAAGAEDRWNASVTINKPSNRLILRSPWVLDASGQSFTFTKGIVAIADTATDYLYFTDNYTVTGASNASYVDGPVRVKRWTSDPFEFPIGDDGFYGPARVSEFWGAAENTVFSARYFHKKAPYPLDQKEDTLENVSKVEWWLINVVSGSVSGTPPYLWLSYDNARSGGVTVPASLRVTRWDAPTSLWQDRGNGLVEGSFIRSTQQVGQLSPFTLASIDAAANPLPVHLINFTAQAKDQYNLLEWTADNEVNFDSYVIESSSDGNNFISIGNVKAVNDGLQHSYSFNDATPASKTFYRLKLLDIDGQFKYSNVIVINRSVRGFNVVISPNPVKDHFILNITSEFASTATIKLIDAQGRMLRKQQTQLKSGVNSFDVKTGTLPQGAYFVEVKTNHGERVVKQLAVMQ